MKKTLLPLVLLVLATKLQGQVGVNTTSPKATLDIVGIPATITAADGLIAPRLTRAQLIAKTAYGSGQQGAIVYVTDTSGTVGNSTLKVTGPGYYYFDGTLWQAIGGTPAVAATEPWNVQGGTTPSASNTDNIYQTGAVAIKKQTGITGADLDVFGAIRGGAALGTATVGANSIAVGEGSTAEGANSATFGKYNINKAEGAIVAGGTDNTWNGNTVGATALASAVFGHHNTVDHQISLVAGYGNELKNGGGTNFVFGDQNKIDGNYSWNAIFGRENTNIKGNKGFVAGERNSISNDFEVALGNQNFTFPNAALTVGKGLNSNSFTISNNAGNNLVAINSGNVAPTAASTATKLKVYGDTEVTTKLGIGTFTTAPTNALHVKATTDPVKLEGLQADASASNVVVVGADGVLKTIDKSLISPVKNIITQTASYTVLATDETILVNNSADATITLPVASASNKGKIYNIKKIATNENFFVTITAGASTIDGVASIYGATPKQGWTLQSDGSAWYLVSRF